MTDPMHSTATRVLAISTLSGDGGAGAEEAALVREYFRRVKALADAAGGWSGGPFFAPEEVVGKALDEERLRTLADVETWIAQPNADVRNVCVNAVKWAGYADQGERLAAAHRDVFDPLLQLFERGHEIRVDAGEVMMHGSSVPLATWRG